jgi:tetratricopeptide (TPR) repeat protein
VAVLVEDVHWADPSTLDLLDLVVRDSPGGRTLLCVTGRPEFLSRWSSPHVRTIELPRLSNYDIEAIVTHIAGGNTLPAFVVRQIAERSEGVPLFVEEVTRAVLESGALRLETNRYELSRSFDEQLIPATVQASLLARFDRLGESRSVAQLGAAIGRDFTYPLIRAVAGLSDDQIREHLDRLCRSELAFSKGEPPNSLYMFKHALIQDAIYGTLLKRDRLRVHERIFTKLRDHFPDVIASRPEMAAYHAENAGLRDLAVPLLKDAGMRAFGRTAMAEAVKHLSRAIELVEALEEPARSSTESELQGVMGPAYMATLGWAAPEVERSSARLRELAIARGDGAKLFQAMWGLWTVHFLRGRLDPAIDLARQVLEMALQTGDPMLTIAGHHAVGYTHVYRGEYAEALQHADEGLARFDLQLEKRIASIFGLSSGCALWLFRAQAQQALGHAREASASLRRAQELADDLGHAPSRAYVLCQLCNLFRLFDDVDQVKVWAPAMRSLSTAEGFALWIPLADVFLAWTTARQGGDAARAAETIQACVTYVHESGTYLNEPDLACMLAETLLLARRPEDALRAAQDALEVAREGKIRHGEPELFRLQGDAAKAMGKSAEAAAFYRRGIESSRAMRAKFLELRCALGLARLGGEGEGQAALRTVLDGFTEGFDQSEYKQAVELLEHGARGAPTRDESSSRDRI